MLERISLKLSSTKAIPLAIAGLFFASLSGYAQGANLPEQFPENVISPLNEILDSAMTQSDRMELRDIAERDYEGRRIVSSSPQNIQVGSNVTYRKEQELERANSMIADRLFYSLVLSKSLYHWGALEAGKKKGEISLEIEELKSFDTYRLLAIDIRKQYLAIILAKKELEISQQKLDRANAQLALESDRLKAGNASVIQVYNLEVAAGAAELDLLRKENTLDDRVKVLARLAGIEVSDISTSLPSSIPAIEALTPDEIAQIAKHFDEGVATSPKVQTFSKSMEYYQSDLKIANQRRKPKIGLSVGLTQFELDERGSRRAQEIFYGGVNVSWNIFDGGSTKGSKVSAMARLEQIRKQYEYAKSDYQFSLERAQSGLDLSARILKREEAALEQSKKHLRDVKVEVEQGRASNESIDVAQISLASQEHRVFKSRADYLNALVNLSSLLGFDPYAQKFIDSRAE